MYCIVFHLYLFLCFMSFFIWGIHQDQYWDKIEDNWSWIGKWLLIYRAKKSLQFPIHFVHKSRKYSNFRPTWGHKRSRDFVMVRPIFVNLVSKDAWDFNGKSHESAMRNFFALPHYREISGGGGHDGPPQSF